MRYIFILLALLLSLSSCLKSPNNKYKNYMKCHIDGKKWHSKSMLLSDTYHLDFHLDQDTIKHITLSARRYNSNHKQCFGHDRMNFEFPVDKLIGNFEAPFVATSNLDARYYNGSMKNSEIESYNAPTPYQVINYPSTQAELTITSIIRLEDCYPDVKDNKYLYVENIDGQCFVIKGIFSFSGTNSFNETKVITNGKFRLKDYLYQ